LFTDLITFYYYCIVALFTASAVIISNVTLLFSYNYSSIKNVLSTVNKLKITAKILCHQAEKLNINIFITLFTLLFCLHQLHSYLLLHHYNEQ